jgi:HEAT repeat protein
MSTVAPIVISSAAPPVGTPYDLREVAASKAFLQSNGYADSRQGMVRATEAEHAALRTAAYHLLAEDAQSADRELLSKGLEDSESAVRAWAAFGLEKLHPGDGIDALREFASHQPQFAEYGPLVAAVALARLKDPAGFTTVQEAMHSFDERIPVVRCLFWFAPLGIPELWPLYELALADATPGVRQLALLQLRQLAAPEAAAVLQRHLAAQAPDSSEAEPAQAIVLE